MKVNYNANNKLFNDDIKWSKIIFFPDIVLRKYFIMFVNNVTAIHGYQNHKKIHLIM